MMNGYSVTEAASVLGVPTERVWELLARGVLAGAPEGETGMRVFLQPRAAAPSITATDEPAAATNGPEREMSPFRELLTEFRNLTERYGQALLALGESRGEVASLRSRVDLLEARIDLRLPMGAPAASPWPTQPLPVSEPGASKSAVEHAAEEASRSRRRGARRATESFAEALARAEDPSPADLPSSAAAGVASHADSVDDDRSLPRDVLPAEPILVADAEEEAVEPIPFDEPPEWSADEPGASVADTEASGSPTADEVTEEKEAAVADELAEPGVAEMGAGAVADVTGSTEEAEAAVDAEPAPPAAIEPDEQIADDGVAEAPETSSWAEAVAGVEDEERPADAAAEPVGLDEPAPDEPAAGSEPVAGRDAPTADERPIEGEAAAAQEFDAERYSAVIDQPDWFEAEADDEWSSASPGAGEPSEPSRDIETDAGGAGEPSESPRDIETDAGGADEMEVAGGHAGAQGDDQPGDLPGSLELGDALDAYGDLGRSAPELTEPEDEWPPARAAEGPAAPTSYHPGGFTAGPPSRIPGSVTGVGPANRAYRRLRRIFPT